MPEQVDLAEWLPKKDVCALLGIGPRTLDRVPQNVIEVKYRPMAGRRPLPVCNPDDVARYGQTMVQPVVFDNRQIVPSRESGADFGKAIGQEFALALAEPVRELAARIESSRRDVEIKDKIWLTMDEAVRFSGLTRDMLVNAAESKTIQGFKSGRNGGGVWRFKRKSIEEF